MKQFQKGIVNTFDEPASKTLTQHISWSINILRLLIQDSNTDDFDILTRMASIRTFLSNSLYEKEVVHKLKNQLEDLKKYDSKFLHNSIKGWFKFELPHLINTVDIVLINGFT